LSWMGFTAALAGVGLIAGHGGDGATLLGDGLVFASLLASAAFVVAQPGILRGRDPVAVTAVQLAAGAVAALPVAGALAGLPAAPRGHAALGAVVGLAIAGTLLPFTLFAYAQTRVAPEIAGAFLNLEPLVGAVVGVLAFGDPFGATQLLGGSAILAGIAITTVPIITARTTTRLRPADRLAPAVGNLRDSRERRHAVGVRVRGSGYRARVVARTAPRGHRVGARIHRVAELDIQGRERHHAEAGQHDGERTAPPGRPPRASGRQLSGHRAASRRRRTG